MASCITFALQAFVSWTIARAMLRGKDWLAHFAMLPGDAQPSLDEQRSVIDKRLERVISTMDEVLQTQV